MFVMPGGTQTGYKIPNSLRFNAANTTYLSRTPTVAGNTTTWTWSGWVKRGSLGITGFIFGGGVYSTSNDQTGMQFRSDDTIQIFQNNGASTVLNKITSQVFRDSSAHYHIVLVYDTNNATAEDRVRFYVNGNRVVSFSTNTLIALSGTSYVNTSAYSNRLGHSWTTDYFDGYLSEVNFIDGQALPPTAFGKVDPINPKNWVPVKYTGTYGSNGSYLPFSNGTNLSTLSTDASPNGNNWGTNGMVRDGSVNDCWSYDTPTKNFATLNQLSGQGSSAFAMSNGGLTDFSGNFQAFSFPMPTTGKWYFEVVLTQAGSNAWSVGIASDFGGLSAAYANVGDTSFQYGYYANGFKRSSGSSSIYGASWTQGDRIGVAFDADGGTLTFYKNGVSQGVAFSGIPSAAYALALQNYTNSLTPNIYNINFGQVPIAGGSYSASAGGFFLYTPPSGFRALCTANLPNVAIRQPGQHMDVVTYNGTGGTNVVTGFNFPLDFLWAKSRSLANSHIIVDSSRGATNYLNSNNTAAEVTSSSIISSLNLNGFTLGADTTVNTTSSTNVSWGFESRRSGSFKFCR